MQINIDTQAFTNNQFSTCDLPKGTFKLIETYHITQSCFIISYLKLSKSYSCILKTPKSAILINVYL